VKDDEHRPWPIVGSLGDVDRVGARDAANIQSCIEVTHGGILARFVAAPVGSRQQPQFEVGKPEGWRWVPLCSPSPTEEDPRG
jgi:hypothetical protein